MRLAVLTSSISRNAGGLFYSVRSLHKALAAEGVATRVFALGDQFTEADIPLWDPLPLGVHATLGPRSLGLSPSMGRELRGYGPDLVHVHGLWQGPSVASLQQWKATRRPYLISPRGMLDPWAYRHSRWKKRIAGALFEFRHLRSAACIHALCQSEADSIRAFGLRNPIAIIPNGVEMPEQIAKELSVVGGPLSVNADESQGAARKHIRQQTTDNGQRILLFLGRIHPKKGLVNALRAWAELSHSKFNIQNSTFTNWQFVVSGWDQGGHEAELKRLCHELGLAFAETAAEEMLSVVGCPLSARLDGASHTAKHPCEGPARGSSGARGGDLPTTDNGQRTTVFPSLSPDPCPLSPVIFTGPVFGEAKDALLRSADAFILPSFSEGLPMAVLEAWAYGLPVLMTDHCNLPEGFAANAALRIGTDVESIAEGMRELMSLPAGVAGGELSVVGCRLSEVLDEGAAHSPSSRQMNSSRDERSASLRPTDNGQRTTDNGPKTTSLVSMGRRGRALVERQFTWPQVAAQMKCVYDWVLGGGNAPECVTFSTK